MRASLETSKEFEDMVLQLLPFLSWGFNQMVASSIDPLV